MVKCAVTVKVKLKVMVKVKVAVVTRAPATISFYIEHSTTNASTSYV